MVLQRGVPIKVWGTQSANRDVTVRFAGQTVTGKSDEKGTWEVTLAPLEANAKGQTLIATGKSTARLENVVVGEVWLFGRQTTIEVSLKATAKGPVSEEPFVRYFSIETCARAEPQADLPPAGDVSGGRILSTPLTISQPRVTYENAHGPWRVCTSEGAGGLSGAAYYFARDLQNELGVPVGVIDIPMGPSVLESWMSPRALKEVDPEGKLYGKQRVGHGDRYADRIKQWNEKEAWAAYEKSLAAWKVQTAGRLRNGNCQTGEAPVTPVFPGNLLLYPSGCYNACIVPIQRFPMRGVLLYQGANYPHFAYRDVGKDFSPRQAVNAMWTSYTYKKLHRYGLHEKSFPAFVPDWRRTWGNDDLAFGIIQPCGSGSKVFTHDTGSKLAFYREAQAKTCAALAKTGLIVAFDLSQPGSRQVRDEKELGIRCLRWALADVYGRKDVVASGPELSSSELSKNAIILHFAGPHGLKTSDGKELRGFQIGRQIRNDQGAMTIDFVVAPATIAGNTVVVSTKPMPDATAVRYAWATSPDGNLVNDKGLPAAPFRTDDFKGGGPRGPSLPEEFSRPMNEWKEQVQILTGQQGRTMPLGPTGLNGYILGRNIFVHGVDPRSPADGIIQVGDALVAANGKTFGADPRIVLGTAIDESQREASKGALKLTIVRGGEVKQVDLQLEVMGSYSETSPYDCPKVAKILANAREYIVEQMGADGNVGLCGGSSGLQLLSSGDPRYLDPVRRIVRRLIPKAMQLKPQGTQNPWVWHPSYEAIFLCEYYMATGDTSVLPAIKRYRDFFAYAQDHMFYAWSHGGSPGSVPTTAYAGLAYGRVNMAGLPCFVAWALTRECGVPVDEKLFEGAEDFFRKKIVDGRVPYGANVIGPLKDVVRPENFGRGLLPGGNGKNGAAAVVFNLINPGDPVSRQCAAVVADSYQRREKGHGGEFFSYLWGPIGASLAGRDAFVNFMAKQRWYYALTRRFDHGLITLQGGVRAGKHLNCGPEYPTGAYCLGYAVPDKGLRILGGPKSVFGQKWTGAMAEAVKLHQGKRYDKCLTLLAANDGVARTEAGQQLAKASRNALASIGMTLAAIKRDVELGDLYMAKRRLEALELIAPASLEPCARLKTRLADEKNAQVLKAGGRFYANNRKVLVNNATYVEAVASPKHRKSRDAMVALSKDASAGVYRRWAGDLLAKFPIPAVEQERWVMLTKPNEHPWRMTVAEREPLLPKDWKDESCDESGWYQTTLPNIWWLDHWGVWRTTFRLSDKEQYRKLRLSMCFLFCSDIEVFLNGKKIVRGEKGVELCDGVPSIILGPKAMRLLRKGENQLVIKALNSHRWSVYGVETFQFRLEGTQ